MDILVYNKTFGNRYNSKYHFLMIEGKQLSFMCGLNSPFYEMTGDLIDIKENSMIVNYDENRYLTLESNTVCKRCLNKYLKK